jgi:hypothetical protein
MVNPEPTPLTGSVEVEVDECLIGGTSDLGRGRRHGAHALVIVAAEVPTGTGRIRLQVIDASTDVR